MLIGHGDDAYRYGKEIIADFSSNVWYGGEPVGLKEHLFHNWPAINKYPEAVVESLAKKIGAHHQLPASNILITNGTTESIYLVAHAFRKSNTSIVVPSFSEYEDACNIHNHTIKFLEWEDLKYDIHAGSNLFFLCNPNNPTGWLFKELESVIRNNQNTVFVIDEAFIEFTFSIETLIHLVGNYTNLIILRSLTKAYAIPGLRLGYIAAHHELLEKIKALKAPWSVNALAIASGHFIFDHFSTIQLPLQQLLKNKEVFNCQVQALSIITWDSHTHFFLAETKTGTAAQLKEYLIHNHSILIRDASNFRGLSENHFRVATLAPDKNIFLIEALKEWEHHCC